MIRAALPLACVALAGLSAPAAAQDASAAEYQPSAEYQQCMRQPDAVRGNATALDMCLGVELTVQQERMGNAFDRVFDNLTGWDQVRLYNDQIDWRKGLDGRCADKARKPDRVGTDSLAFNTCLTLEYAARAEWLDDYSPE
jgi:uncharacterized protein YecT (DUF1311 family)